jgi:glycine cleavage system H protein
MSETNDIRTDRVYTRDHEWAKPENTEILVGISAFAVDQLGDITLVDFTVAPGDVLTRHQVFGTVESVKTLSDLFSPVAGRVLRINQELLNHPEWVNEDCWDKSWMIALEPELPLAQSEHLLDPATYRSHVEASQR